MPVSTSSAVASYGTTVRRMAAAQVHSQIDALTAPVQNLHPRDLYSKNAATDRE